MEILSNMVEELRNDSHVAKTCNKCNRGSEGSYFIESFCRSNQFHIAVI